MNFLTDICCICLKPENCLRRLFNSCENLNYYSRLTLLLPEMISTVLCNHGSICSECCNKVDGFYKFREQCLKNNQTYINYKRQLSSASETSDDLCIYLTNLKNEQNNCEKDENNSSRNNSLTECSSGSVLLNETSEKCCSDSYIVTGGDHTGMNMNDGTDYDMPPDDTKDIYNIKKEIDIKTEYGDTDEDTVTAGIDHKDKKENYKVISDEYHDNTKTEEIYIKSEPADTRECEGDELENAAVLDTGSDDSRKTYCITSTDDMSQYNYKTNIIINEEIDIKSEYGDDSEYEESTAEQDTARGTSSSNLDESSLVMTKSTNLIRRKRTYSGDRPFKCEQCDKTYSHLASLIRHKRMHSGDKPFKCDQCDRAFSDSSYLISHKRTHSGERPFKCDQCDKSHSQLSSLIRHKRIHSEERPFRCNHCGKAFLELSNLNKHKRIHSGEKPYKCDQCDKAFSDSSHLISHKRIHSGERPFKCDQCGKAHSQISSLIRHKRTHSGERPFKCNQCDKAFLELSNLNKHKRIHSGEKPFKCDQCDRAFSESSHLTSHKRIHSGERPFKCDQCGKAHSQISSLIRHKRTHSGEKPFKCEQCDKAFSELSSLIKHKRTHSGEKPFKCEQCDKAFSDSSNLTKHKRLHS